MQSGGAAEDAPLFLTAASHSRVVRRPNALKTISTSCCRVSKSVSFFFKYIYYFNSKLGNSFFHSHYTQIVRTVFFFLVWVGLEQANFKSQSQVPTI